MIKTKKTFKAGETAYLATETGAIYVKAIKPTEECGEYLETEVCHIDKSGNAVGDSVCRFSFKPKESCFCSDYADALDLSIKLAKDDADEWRKRYHASLTRLFDLKGERIALRQKQRVAKVRAKERNGQHGVQFEKTEC